MPNKQINKQINEWMNNSCRCMMRSQVGILSDSMSRLAGTHTGPHRPDQHTTLTSTPLHSTHPHPESTHMTSELLASMTVHRPTLPSSSVIHPDKTAENQHIYDTGLTGKWARLNMNVLWLREWSWQLRLIATQLARAGEWNYRDRNIPYAVLCNICTQLIWRNDESKSWFLISFCI